MEYEWRRKQYNKAFYNIKERPQNRIRIDELLLLGHSLEQLQKGYYMKDGHRVFLTPGLTKQARKMLQEKSSSLEIDKIGKKEQ